MDVVWNAIEAFANSPFGAGALGAVFGALVGGLATALTARSVYKSEEKRRLQARFHDTRRSLTVDLLRALGELRELRWSPERNLDRSGSIESSASSALALFSAHLEMPHDWGIKEWVTRVYDGINESRKGWLDHHVYQGYIAEQLLGWSAGDRSYPVEWFEELCEPGVNAFVPTDLAPSNIRIDAVRRRKVR